VAEKRGRHSEEEAGVQAEEAMVSERSPVEEEMALARSPVEV
jgi:hypothetical protein